VQFVRDLNGMMGLRSISEKIAQNLPEVINEAKLGKYINLTRKNLSRNRRIVARHTVRPGETVYSIAKKYYGNQYLWPDLYYLNKNRFEDPDLLRPGDTINIYEKLGDPKTLGKDKKKQLVQAYITMYRVARALGEKEVAAGKKKKGLERIREGRWTLYTALRYEHDLLDIYEDVIYPEDMEIVDDYIGRFGYGDGTGRLFWKWF